MEQARAIGIREVIWKSQTIGEMGDLLAEQLREAGFDAPLGAGLNEMSAGAPLERLEGVSQP